MQDSLARPYNTASVPTRQSRSHVTTRVRHCAVRPIAASQTLRISVASLQSAAVGRDGAPTGPGDCAPTAFASRHEAAQICSHGIRPPLPPGRGDLILLPRLDEGHAADAAAGAGGTEVKATGTATAMSLVVCVHGPCRSVSPLPEVCVCGSGQGCGISGERTPRGGLAPWCWDGSPGCQCVGERLAAWSRCLGGSQNSEVVVMSELLQQCRSYFEKPRRRCECYSAAADHHPREACRCSATRPRRRATAVIL